MFSPIPKPPSELLKREYRSNIADTFEASIPIPLSFTIKYSFRKTIVMEPERLLYLIAFEIRLSISLVIFITSI